MLLILHATRPTPHGASRLVQAMFAWSVKTRCAPSRHCRDARVYGHTTTAMHDTEYTPPPPRSTMVHLVASPVFPGSCKVELETASLREKEELNAKWGQIMQVAKTERVDLESKASALQDRCTALKERRRRIEQDVDRGRAQLSTSSGRYSMHKDRLAVPASSVVGVVREVVTALPDADDAALWPTRLSLTRQTCYLNT